MDDILQPLLEAADHHAETSGEPRHTAADLHALLREAWRLMDNTQRLKLLESRVVGQVLEAGAEGDEEGSAQVGLIATFDDRIEKNGRF